MKAFILVLAAVTLAATQVQKCNKITDCPEGQVCRIGYCGQITEIKGNRDPCPKGDRLSPLREGCKLMFTKYENNCIIPLSACMPKPKIPTKAVL
ncbi:hypothetical protein OESDEN_11663 [Oesophagostomum dentatum]|uniref:CC domain-containing protein n=1 Tax=Oesophagostomum dentatum TaxID=61180 RepID=A0A0B1SYG4_OESDE|nr:hypothetical protein OESDEN_11663 [Oesophagostomum dentatum]